jgi:hypothetical protein
VTTPSQPIICLRVKHPLLIKQRNTHRNLSSKKFHFSICCHCCWRYSFICPPLRIIHINDHLENSHYAHVGSYTYFWHRSNQVRHAPQFEALYFSSFLFSPYPLLKRAPRKHARTHTHTHQSNPICIVSNDKIDTLLKFKRICYKVIIFFVLNIEQFISSWS